MIDMKIVDKELKEIRAKYSSSSKRIENIKSRIDALQKAPSGRRFNQTKRKWLKSYQDAFVRAGMEEIEKANLRAQTKKNKNFYQSKAWLSLRYRAFILYGKKCFCCEATQGEMHVDHIKPRSKFPELELNIENLQILCRACNLGKDNKDETDWRQKQPNSP